MVKVIIQKEIKMFFPYKNLFKKILKKIVVYKKIKKNVEVNLIIVSNQKIQKISKKYKQKNQQIDVLSFPADWKQLEKFVGYYMLGDIFMSKDQITLQAKKYNHSTKREWAYLFTHGILHLLNYNHITNKDEKIMNSLASLIMKQIKVVR